MKKPKSFKSTTFKSGKRLQLSNAAHRDTAQEWYRSSSWSKYRFKFLAANPKCYICGEKATVVDHLKIHRGDLELFWDRKNHMGCCVPCHNRLTAMFDRFEVQDFEAKIKWIQENRVVQIPIKVIGGVGENC